MPARTRSVRALRVSSMSVLALVEARHRSSKALRSFVERVRTVVAKMGDWAEEHQWAEAGARWTARWGPVGAKRRTKAAAAGAVVIATLLLLLGGTRNRSEGAGMAPAELTGAGRDEYAREGEGRLVAAPRSSITKRMMRAAKEKAQREARKAPEKSHSKWNYQAYRNRTGSSGIRTDSFHTEIANAASRLTLSRTTGGLTLDVARDIAAPANRGGASSGERFKQLQRVARMLPLKVDNGSPVLVHLNQAEAMLLPGSALMNASGVSRNVYVPTGRSTWVSPGALRRTNRKNPSGQPSRRYWPQ